MEGVAAPIRHRGDLVGLADRVVEHFALLGDVVDRELHRGGEAADDVVHLVRSISSSVRVAASPGSSLSSRDQQFRLLPIQAARIVELGDGELRAAHLVLRLGAIGPGERHGEADADRVLLRRAGWQALPAARPSRRAASAA